MTEITPPMTVRIDARGLACPAPVIELRSALNTHSYRPLQLVLTADDPVVEFDVPAWCRMTGSHLVNAVNNDGVWEFTIDVPASP